MKKFLLFVSIIYCGFSSMAQQLESTTINTAGLVSDQLSFSIGELAVGLWENQNSYLSEGLLQGEITVLSNGEFNPDAFSVKVYPNPVSHELLIEHQSTDQFKIQLFNANGVLVRDIVSDQSLIKMDLRQIASGNYFLTISNRHKENVHFSIIKS